MTTLYAAACDLATPLSVARAFRNRRSAKPFGARSNVKKMPFGFTVYFGGNPVARVVDGRDEDEDDGEARETPITGLPQSQQQTRPRQHPQASAGGSTASASTGSESTSHGTRTNSRGLNSNISGSTSRGSNNTNAAGINTHRFTTTSGEPDLAHLLPMLASMFEMRSFLDNLGARVDNPRHIPGAFPPPTTDEEYAAAGIRHRTLLEQLIAYSEMLERMARENGGGGMGGSASAFMGPPRASEEAVARLRHLEDMTEETRERWCAQQPACSICMEATAAVGDASNSTASSGTSDNAAAATTATTATAATATATATSATPTATSATATATSATSSSATLPLLLMPCDHLFHEPCIRAWLSRSNACPLCRYELPTDNPEYNRGVEERNHRVAETQPRHDQHHQQESRQQQQQSRQQQQQQQHANMSCDASPIGMCWIQGGAEQTATTTGQEKVIVQLEGCPHHFHRTCIEHAMRLDHPEVPVDLRGDTVRCPCCRCASKVKQEQGGAQQLPEEGGMRAMPEHQP